MSRWKRTFQNACTLLGSYTPFFLDTLIVCVFPLYIRFDKKKKKIRVESFGETDHVEIKRGFFAIHLRLNSRIRVSPAIEKGNK